MDVPLPSEAALRAIPRERFEAVLRSMPKAELHMHIEGSLEPELMLTIAERNALPLPYPDIDAARRAYAFDSLQSFLDLYYAGAAVLTYEEDFYDLAWAYLSRAAADNVVRAEVFFDPQTHTDRGVPFEVVITGLTRALVRARHELGVDGALIMCFLRHLGEEAGFTALDQALPYLDHIIGFGLDSSERGYPPEGFARLFARCRELGMHVVAHAGEEGPADYVRSALDVLRVERIDHGVHAGDDPPLVTRLAAEGVPLTVCPLSNVKLAVFPSLAEHNLADLLHAGVRITINSDDPAYFGGYVNDNYAATFAALRQLTAKDAYQLAHNSIAASFASPADKARWIGDLVAVFAAAAASA